MFIRPADVVSPERSVLNVNEIPSPVDDALVAASPFNLARRAARGLGGAPWGGIRHKYSESEWVRDRRGRWMKYIGMPWQESWKTDASGRETPAFATGNVFDSRIGQTPRYKNRIVSPKLDDGSVVMEVGNSVRDLGRHATPDEGDWASLPTDLPDHVPDGATSFVRRSPDTMELVSDPAGKIGGRGRLTPAERARRGQIGQGPRARVGEEIIGPVDELDLPEIVIPDEVAESLAGLDGTEALQDYLREWGPDAQGRQMLDDMLDRAQTGRERNQLRKARKVLLSWANDEIGEPYAQEPDAEVESPYIPVDGLPQWDDINEEGRLWGWEGDPANPNDLRDDLDPTLRLRDDGQGAIIMEDLADPDNPRRWTFDRTDPDLMDNLDMARSGAAPTDDELMQMAPVLDELDVPDEFPGMPAQRVPPVERGLVPRPRRGGEIPTPEVMDLHKRMEEIADEHLLADPVRKEQIWGEFQALLKQRNAAWYDPQTAQRLDEQSAIALSPERRALLREIDPDFDSYPMLDQVDLLDGMQDQFTAVPGLEREEFDGAYAEVMEDLAFERENADELYGEYPDEEGLYDELDVPAGDDDVLPDEDRAALEEVLADELDQALAEEPAQVYPNIEQAKAHLSSVGWAPDSEDPETMVSPDGQLRAMPVTTALGQTFDAVFVEDVQTGEAVLWDADRGGPFGEWLTDQLNTSGGDRFAQGWTEPLPKYTGVDDGLSEGARADAIRSNMFGTIDLDNETDPEIAERNNRIKELMAELAKDDNLPLLQRFNDELGGGVGADSAADVLYEYGWDPSLGSPAEALPRLIDAAGQMIRDYPMSGGPTLREVLDGGLSDGSGVSADNFDWERGEGVNLGFAERVFGDMTRPGGLGGIINEQSLQNDYGVSPGDAARFLDEMEAAGLLERDGASGGWHSGPAIPEDWESVPAAVRKGYPASLGGGSNMDQPPFDQWLPTPTDQLLPFENQKFTSPDGEWELFQDVDGAWQLVNDTSGEFHGTPYVTDPGKFVDSVFGGEGGPVDELDVITDEDLGAPAPVRRYKPGAHRGERAGRGENRGWISRPMGYRAADFRERDRRRAIEESVTEGGWDLPETATRQSIREAAVEAGVSDKTLQRIDSALSPLDVVDALDEDSAVDVMDELDIPGVGSDARLAVAKLLAQMGLVDKFDDDPVDAHPTASEEEVEASGAAAADAARRIQQPLIDQFQEIMDFYGSHQNLLSHVAKRNFTAVKEGGGRNIDKRPKWQQYIEDLARFDSLPDKRKQTLLSMLDKMREDIQKEQLKANGDEKTAAHKEIADRLIVLVDSIKQRTGKDLHDWSKAQQEAQGRLDGAEGVMAMKQPSRPYRYMDDYKDVADYSTPDQEARIAAAENTLGDVALQAVDVFAKDNQLEREFGKIRDDFADFINRSGGGPLKDQVREALLERAINQARLVAGTGGQFPELERFLVQALELRAEGHGQTMPDMLADTSWDVPDDELKAIYDALLQFTGKGTNKGEALLNAALSIKDILPGKRAKGRYNVGFAPGSPERWAALMRARNNLDIAHGEQTIPIMHALGVKPDPRRVRKLLNPKFNLAPENFGSRPTVRGTGWSQSDLDVMSGAAEELRAGVVGDTSRRAGRYRHVAKLLESAVGAYEDQDYGAFESISEVAMSFLSGLGQPDMYQRIGALREARHGPGNWNAKWDQLEKDLIDIFGKVPKGQGISNAKSTVPTEISYKQKAMGLIAEAAKRPQGSLDQRTKLASALWYLNQVNDPKDADLRDALGPFGANGDLHRRQAAPYQRRQPGTASDARIARAQEIAQQIKDEGWMSADDIGQAFGLVPERIDGLVEPLIQGDILRLLRRLPDGTAIYGQGPNFYVKDGVLGERPLTRAELDDLVLKAMVGGNVMPSPVSPKPIVSHAFVDSRIVKRNMGGDAADVVVGLGPATTPDRNVTAYWDASQGHWVLSTFAVGDWKTFGGPVDQSGAEVSTFMSLDALRYGLTALADLNKVPYPDPVVASIEPEDVAVEVRDDVAGGTTVVVVVVDDGGDEGDDGEGDDVLVLPVSDYLEPPPDFEEPVYPTQLPVFPVGEEEIL